jgi:hypothetical protein
MRLLRIFAPVTCVLAAAAISPLPFSTVSAGSDRTLHRALGEDNVFCRIYLDPHDVFTRVVPEPRASIAGEGAMELNAVLSNITVNYTGFASTPAAQAAFQAAVDIWKTQVASSVPIVIDAQFTDLGNTLLLGQAGSGATRDFPGTPRAGTFYPFPLANKVTGTDIGAQFFGPGSSNISAQFNSNAAVNWYFGTDALVPSGKVDFESVVLHELGHGLGFLGAAGYTASTNQGSVGSGGFPYVYDLSVVDALSGGNSLLNTAVYPNPGTTLGNALRSDSLYWDGTNGKSANNGTRPKLYAPATFSSGSTYSHLDELTYPAGDINSLMTPVLHYAEAIHTPGPIMLGMFADMGWGSNAGAQCNFGLDRNTATVTPAGGTVSVTLSTTSSCAWTATTGASFVTGISPSSGSTSAVVSMTVAANAGVSPRVATVTIGSQTLTITQNGTGPTMALDRTALIFTGVSNGASFTASTGAQAVRMTQSGAGTVTWTASSNQPWLLVAAGSGTPGAQASGTGSATLTISVQFTPGLAASQGGAIALSFTGAGNMAGPITVTLNTLPNGTSVAPVGSFDTPLTGTTGIAGSLPVTGWALDDVGVTRVRIMRDPVAGEPAGVKVYIGDAVFIDGARSDVQTQYPTLPRNTRAGWGYLMLTNFLPNGGNGTFALYAYADDADGHTTLLGSKTITCDNASSIAPFGAIDRPTQGEVISGVFLNAGWALSPGNRFADVPDGGTVNVLVDGVVLGSPTGWAARSDITSLFPVAQYAGVNKAVAGFGLDTTVMTNGVHQIAWIVTATSGGTSGVGSRFFSVSNGSLLLDPTPAAAVTTGNVIAARAVLDLPRGAAMRIDDPLTLASEIDAAPADLSAIQGRRGFDLDMPLVTYASAGGRVTVQSEEVDRVELHLSSGGRHQYTGYLRTVGGVTPLPIGSTLDATTGAFAWQPGVGFVGRYDLVFVRWSGGQAVARQDVRIVLNPKGSNRVGPQTIVDLPAPTAQGRGPIVVSGSFFLAGWAADLDSTEDRGVDTVHVWAYPVTEAGGRDAPTFLGAAVYAGARPDVAAVYGDRFKDTGYGLIVPGLAPGTYDVAVFSFSTVRGGFAPAKVVRVTVR